MAEPRRVIEPEPVLDDGATMPFTEHLRELRVRLRNAILGLIGGFSVCYFFKEEIALLMLRPYQSVWATMQSKHTGDPSETPFQEASMYFTSMLEPFWAFFTNSLWAGLFVASPIVFYQIWQFIAPGLYSHERRYGIVFALASAVCFISGGLFSYEFVLEPVYEFLLGFATSNLAEMAELTGAGAGAGAGAAPVGLKPLLTIQEYLSLARRLILAFGLVFELPLLISFLALIGAVTHRGLLKFNRWWIVLSFVISAMLTPPDLFSQVLMAGPLVVLYNLSIGLAWIITTRRERREAALIRQEDEAAAKAEAAATAAKSSDDAP